MKTFKVICELNNGDEYPLFMRNCETMEDAYSDAKRYMLLERTDLDFRQVKSATEL